MWHNPEKQVPGRQHTKYRGYVEDATAIQSRNKMKFCMPRPELERQGVGHHEVRMERQVEANPSRILSH